MNKKRLIDMVSKDEKWANIKTPAGLKESIMAGVKKQAQKQALWKRILQWAATGALVPVVIIVALLSPNGQTAMAYTFEYPYNGEEKVEIIGEFNDWNKKVVLRLNKRTKKWQANVRIDKKGTYEYQYIVDDVIYTVGSAKKTIVDSDGNEKGILTVM